ncbi:hypothetical protein BH11MYX2_BH11MYX2_06940 [soil metagenome]
MITKLVRAAVLVGVTGTIGATILAACVSHYGDGPRRIVAGELVSEIVVPTYAAVVDTATVMKTAAHALADEPSQTSLDKLRSTWREARIPWKQTDAFRFGPAELQSLGTAMDQSVDPPRIETELSGTQVIDDTYFLTLGANKKGFHAIEYLVFGDDATVLAELTTGSHADRKRAYVASAADDLVTTATALRDQWDAYGETLAKPGSDNAAYQTVKASIDSFMNEIVLQSAIIGDTRIGSPLGTKTGGEVHPELQESAPSDNSVTDMAETLHSMRNVYFGSLDGTPGKGIGELVQAQSPSTNRAVVMSFAAAAEAIAAIPTPYAQAITDQDPRVLTAYTAVQDLRHLLSTEVVATLGSTLKFNDNDGD